MSTDPATAVEAPEKPSESRKLVSLLALAAGAAALPQTSEADIVYTNMTDTPVQVGSLANSSFLFDNLPGTARIGFVAKTRMTAVSYSKVVTVGQKAGYVRVKTNLSFVVPVSAGKTWNTMPGFASVYGFVGVATYGGHFPNGYDHKYLAFQFKDSTLPGTPLRYGWIEISLSNPVNGGDPTVTIWGEAYDTTGAILPTGAVPEPGSSALLALGALALGARGIRTWRSKRAVISNQ